MASQGHPTRVQPPPPAPPPPQAGIDLGTLVITAVASASAAYITAKVWAPGTLASAAFTPVIIALIKEGLRKPTQVVTAVVPTRAGRVRGPETEPLPDDLTGQLERGAPPPFPPPQPGAEAGPVSVYSTRGNRLRWRLAVITGLLGFVVCVLVYTVPELIAGGSVGRPGHSTTLFPSGRSHRSSSSHSTTTTSPTTTSTTPSQTETQPAQTVTQTVTTPAPAPAPAQQQPSSATPQQATPSNQPAAPQDPAATTPTP
jgi:hypothetical protein